jgi:gamma-glutamyl:cysteine ligase YbdK (ATP-grasp superfamily)
MIDNIYPSLESLGNSHVINTLDEIMKSGTEADQQIRIEKKYGVKKLLHFLMDEVEYDY